MRIWTRLPPSDFGDDEGFAPLNENLTNHAIHAMMELAIGDGYEHETTTRLSELGVLLSSAYPVTGYHQPPNSHQMLFEMTNGILTTGAW